MRVIGLTGSIACGKSTISQYLISRGFPVVDGDQISRELTSPGSPVLDEIRHNFGDHYMNENGNLNRRALGQLIFRDGHARSRLDAIMAPHLLRITKEKINRCRSDGAALCFLDMPLLFEKGYDRMCDAVWTVWLPEDLQLSRLIARDHLSEEDALSRIHSVMSSDEKASRADHIIDNSGTVRQTLDQVEKLLVNDLGGMRDSVPSGLSPSPVSRRSRPPISGSSPSPEVRVSVSEPEVMKRPDAARRQASGRKVAWTMPLWLKISLIASAVLLAFSIAARFMMSGYLDNQRKIHADEQTAVYDRYFVKVNKSYDEYVYRFSDQYRDLIIRYASQYNLSPAFVAAVIFNESTFRANVESPVGARGLMQLMPDTAQWIAGKLNMRDYGFEKMLDANTNILFGCWYLNWLSNTFGGDPVCVISAYHAGHNQVFEWLSDRSVSSDGRTIELERLPEGQTKNYARKVVRDYGIYQALWLPGNSADLSSVAAGASAR